MLSIEEIEDITNQVSFYKSSFLTDMDELFGWFQSLVESQEQATQEETRKEIGKWLEKFTDFDGDSLRPILTREWATVIEALKKGKMPL